MKSLKIVTVILALVVATPFAFAQTYKNVVASSSKTKLELIREKASTTVEDIRAEKNALRMKASTTRTDLQNMRVKIQEKKRK